MTKFLETTRGTYVNLDHVRFLRPEKNRAGDNVVVATLADHRDNDECTRVDCWPPLAGMETFLTPIVPAQPGFFALTIFYDDDAKTAPENIAECVNKDAVVAWAMADDEVKPITLECSGARYASVTAVQSPDGKITIAGINSFFDMDTFYVWVRADWQRSIDREKKRRESAPKEAAE